MSPLTLLPELNVPALPLTPSPALNAAPSPSAGAPKATIVPQEFEAMLLTQLLKGMRRTVPEATEPSTARDLYHELHDEMMANHLARNGGIGIAAIIRAYLDRTPGAAGGGKK